MEDYPEELLVGIFPLVFCVDATLQKSLSLKTKEQQATTAAASASAAGTTTVAASSAGNDNDNNVGITDDDADGTTTTIRRISSSRSQFDKFLDAMTASILDGLDSSLDHLAGNGESTTGLASPKRTRTMEGAWSTSSSTTTTATPSSNHEQHHSHGHSTHLNNPMMSLFRPDDDVEDSDTEDDIILCQGSTPKGPGEGKGNLSHDPNQQQQHGKRRNNLPKIGFPRLGPQSSNKNSKQQNWNLRGGGDAGAGGGSIRSSSNDGGGGGGGSGLAGTGVPAVVVDTAFANTLQHGQEFFQRARIVSISARHGFPPSKDPTSTKNRLRDYLKSGGGSSGGGGPSKLSLQTSKLLAATQRRPIDGILPSGWLEKHAAALPSVILVIVQIHHDQESQKRQDELLQETLQNLHYSLAPKRQVGVHVVALVQDGVSQILADQWSQGMIGKLREQDNYDDDGGRTNRQQHHSQPKTELTLLPVSDLQQDSRAGYSSPTIHDLHSRMRDASYQYYWNLGKDVKEKLIVLGPARRTPLLLPLSIRYCFKLAVFYEFQWKHEKSVKYLIEAYRLVDTYYRYLLQQREVTLYADEEGGEDIEKNVERDGTSRRGGENSLPEIVTTDSTRSHQHQVNTPAGGEGFELSLATLASSSGNNTTSTSGEDFLYDSSPPAADMVFQCRAVADWLNFKIMQCGLLSSTEAGVLAASAQWQRHIQAFCCPRRSFIRAPEASWLDWSYMAQQCLVVSQLLERYPTRALGHLGRTDFEEDLLRCSPWRTYETAMEAFLKTAYQVRLATESHSSLNMVSSQQYHQHKETLGSIRTRYVGCIDHDGFTPMLHAESKINHHQMALSCGLKSLALFEQEVEQTIKAEVPLPPWTRSGARLHYVVAGSLLTLSRHQECILHLEKAASLCAGWSGLESAIHRMFLACYDQYLPSSNEINSHLLVSVFLNQCFKSRMANADLRRMLETFSTWSGVEGRIRWHRDWSDESHDTRPFSFAVTFPATHATVGEGVEANIWIKSNLDCAIHISSVSLLSLVGELTIPSNDLMNARNANEGTNGGIIIQAFSEIELTSRIDLPKDLNQITSDEGGSGVDNSGGAGGKKTARLRTSGITSGAGARFLSAELFGGKANPSSSSYHWSSLSLGGKPLRSDGMRVVFYPVSSSRIQDEKNTEIELTITKTQPKSKPNINRTLFEEENYVSCAWNRPKGLPLRRGPICLRVLPPTANLNVTNFTESFTNGRALEGTVNRVVLQLTAGPDEICSEIELRISCSSSLITQDGSTKRLVLEGTESLDNEDVEDMMNPRVRTPVLVKPDPTAKATMLDYGYSLPDGWALAGDSQGSLDEYAIQAKTLKFGEVMYAYFDVYRPTPDLTRIDGVFDSGENEEVALQKYMCQTGVDVSIRYRQARKVQSRTTLVRRRNRKATMEETERTEAGEDYVSTVFTVPLLWSAPLSAVFTTGSKLSFPSGNRHPSNSLPEPGSSLVYPPSDEKEIVVIHKERVTTRCILEAVASADGLNVEIERVCFADTDDDNPSCHFNLVNSSQNEGVLYDGKMDDPGRKLSLGSQFTTAWMTEVVMQESHLKGSVTASLGVISVYWKPSPMELPADVTIARFEDSIKTHGPIRMDNYSTCRFKGPPCYIENAPFEATEQKILDPVSMAVPFELSYRIKNKTNLDQEIEIKVKDSATPGEESSAFLIGGPTSRTTFLGPLESRIFSFTAVPTKVGRVFLPTVTVASKRYRTWVIDESTARRSIFVVP